MGRDAVSRWLLGAALAAPALLWAPHAQAEVLVYKATNKWVAAEDNKPLVRLQKAARGGKTHFKVKLPKENRALAVARLEVLQGILEREAKDAIVMEEVGVSRAGTIGVE